jgi:hypothetical protein
MSGAHSVRWVDEKYVQICQKTEGKTTMIPRRTMRVTEC